MQADRISTPVPRFCGSRPPSCHLVPVIFKSRHFTYRSVSSILLRMTETTRYPLSWPTVWKRTAAVARTKSDFKEVAIVQRGDWINGQWVAKEAKGSKRVTMPKARDRLFRQLEFLGGAGVLLSTNVELTTYGLPRAGRPEPKDPGVAVYFQLHGKDRVLACDRWATVVENLAALAAHIDAIRRVDRYGVGTLDQAFAGYDALPPPGAANRPPWRKVMGFDEGPVAPEDVNEAYRSLARQFHPDLQGGSHEAMAMLNEARDAALQELAA